MCGRGDELVGRALLDVPGRILLQRCRLDRTHLERSWEWKGGGVRRKQSVGCQQCGLNKGIRQVGTADPDTIRVTCGYVWGYEINLTAVVFLL